MVGFHQEFLAAEIPGEGVDGVVDRVSFALVRVPLLGRTGKPLRTERYWLMFNRTVRVGQNLEKDGPDRVFASIAADDPWQVVPGEIESASILDAVLELVEVFFVLDLPGAGIPREAVVRHLVERGRPLGIIRYVVVEEEGGA